MRVFIKTKSGRTIGPILISDALDPSEALEHAVDDGDLSPSEATMATLIIRPDEELEDRSGW